MVAAQSFWDSYYNSWRKLEQERIEEQDTTSTANRFEKLNSDPSDFSKHLINDEVFISS
jgi:hypothetical protein